MFYCSCFALQMQMLPLISIFPFLLPILHYIVLLFWAPRLADFGKNIFISYDFFYFSIYTDQRTIKGERVISVSGT